MEEAMEESVQKVGEIENIAIPLPAFHPSIGM